MCSEVSVKIVRKAPCPLVIFTRLSNCCFLHSAFLFLISKIAACPTLVLVGDLRRSHSNSSVGWVAERQGSMKKTRLVAIVQAILVLSMDDICFGMQGHGTSPCVCAQLPLRGLHRSAAISTHWGIGVGIQPSVSSAVSLVTSYWGFVHRAHSDQKIQKLMWIKQSLGGME